MVSTRSQDPGDANGGPQMLVAEVSPAVKSKKRKARHELDGNSTGPRTKRRRNAAEIENDTGMISADVDDQSRLNPNEKTFVGVLVPGKPDDGGNDIDTPPAIRVKEAEGPKQSVISKDTQTSNLKPHDSSENEVGTIKVTKASHKRFGSEEMELQPIQVDSDITPDIQIQQASDEKTAVHSDEASDDEAPETVTAVAGFKRARATAANAAKTIERKEAATKQRRRERDVRLNLQAKSSRKRGIIETEQPKTLPTSKNEITENISIQEKADPRSPSSPNTPLPTYLPESILLAEPPNPFPNPLSTLSSSKKTPNDILAKKRPLLGLTKPPKDIKHGSRIIRVLEIDRSGLPPRVSQPSKALREAWLAGRRGDSIGARGCVPRRKVGGGFVRK